MTALPWAAEWLQAGDWWPWPSRSLGVRHSTVLVPQFSQAVRHPDSSSPQSVCLGLGGCSADRGQVPGSPSSAWCEAGDCSPPWS